MADEKLIYQPQLDSLFENINFRKGPYPFVGGTFGATLGVAVDKKYMSGDKLNLKAVLEANGYQAKLVNINLSKYNDSCINFFDVYTNTVKVSQYSANAENTKEGFYRYQKDKSKGTRLNTKPMENMLKDGEENSKKEKNSTSSDETNESYKLDFN